MMRRESAYLLFVAFLLPNVPLTSFCASTTDYSESDWERFRHGERPVKLDDMVPLLEIKDLSLVEFLWNADGRHDWVPRLSRGIVYYDWTAQEKEKSDPKINLRLSSVTVREVLNALTSADTNYYWIQDGDVVNFLPRRKTLPPDVVAKLEERIPALKIQASSMSGAWISMIRQAKLQGIQDLDPRFHASTVPRASEINPDRAPEERITVSLRNKSIREALNAIVAADPPAFWIAYPLPKEKVVFMLIASHAHWPRDLPASSRRPAASTTPAHMDERKRIP